MQLFRTTVVIYIKFFLPALALVAQLDAHPTGIRRFSTVILSLPLNQEGQLLVSGKRMSTVLVNCLLACPVKVWLGKLTALDMTPLCWLGHKTSTQINFSLSEVLGYLQYQTVAQQCSIYNLCRNLRFYLVFVKFISNLSYLYSFLLFSHLFFLPLLTYWVIGCFI